MNKNVHLKKKCLGYKESFLQEGKTSKIILRILIKNRIIITKFDKSKLYLR